MALFSESTVRARAKQETQQHIYKSESQVLKEHASKFSKYKDYDIFLSHSAKDAELILGMKGILEDLGYAVYVDWVDDAQLDRSKVDASTASTLRDRMAASKSLFYVTTENADSSKWMPWECGYFDGFREKVAIVPIKKSPISNSYQGQEYLGLYPYCLKEKSDKGNEMLWIHKDANTYVTYKYWVKTPNAEITWKRL